MGAKQHLIVGDARRMPELDDDSVHLVVTSPPYWQLKDYGREGQIGFHQDLEHYHDALGEVWSECARVLHPGCRLCINIGDQFARKEIYGRYKVVPLHAEIIRRAEELRLDFMGSVIWQKVTTCNSSGGGALMGSYPHPRNGVVKLDYEHVLLFKKPGKAPAVSAATKESARMGLEEWKTWFNGHWQFPGARGRSHLAPFPVELPRRLIRMFSFPGERVLDPFVGSGTTLVAAAELDREGIGVEIDEDAVPIIRERLAGGDGDLPFEACDLEVSLREVALPSSAMESPYFGSVVKAADRGRRRHAGTREHLDSVLGPHSFKTRSGRVVRLLGTTPRAGAGDAAEARLLELLSGKGFLLTNRRREDLGIDDECAYVHLLDRTFVNSRMIREGLLACDPGDADHPHRTKFLREEG